MRMSMVFCCHRRGGFGEVRYGETFGSLGANQYVTWRDGRLSFKFPTRRQVYVGRVNGWRVVVLCDSRQTIFFPFFFLHKTVDK